MQKEKEIPALPPAPVAKLAGLREKALRVLTPFLGKEVGGPEIRLISSELSSTVLKEHSSRVRGATAATVEAQMLGDTLTYASAKKLAFSVAGNTELLRAGVPVHPWSGQRYAEWAILAVINAAAGKPIRGVLSVDLRVSVLTGAAAGLVYSQLLPGGYFPVFLHVIGAKPRKDWRRPVPQDAVRMLFFGLLESGDKLNAGRVAVSGGLKSRNRRTYLSRYDKRVCPRKYKWSCAACPVGYSTCPMGTHPLDYVRGTCLICGEGWFNDNDHREKRLVCTVCWGRGKRLGGSHATGRSERPDGVKREIVAESGPGPGPDVSKLRNEGLQAHGGPRPSQ